MNKVQDITNKRFGRLMPQRVSGQYLYKSGYSENVWQCLCDCGNIVHKRAGYLKSGDTKSCGCFKKDKLTRSNMSRTRFYKIHTHMLDRCFNINSDAYKYYGARGIKVCKKWLKFENFRDDMYKPYLEHCEKHGEKRTSIDRTNNNGIYKPSNCRWATPIVQANNKRKWGTAFT